MTKEKDLFDLMPPPGVPMDVLVLFEKLALEVKRSGWNRYSARAILQRIRWHYHMEKGDRSFKCNNNWTPGISRWLMKKHPVELGEFFEIRELIGAKSEWVDDDEAPSART